MVPPQKVCPHPGICKCDLNGKRDYLDVITLRMYRYYHPGLSRWLPKPVAVVLTRDTQSGGTEREEGQVKMQQRWE